MKDETDLKQLQNRINHLEENRRYVQNALETVLSVSDFQEDVSNQRSPRHILKEAQKRISQIIPPFEASALYLVDEKNSNFLLSLCEPDQYRQLIESKVEFLIDNGFFGWALCERRGVLLESKDLTQQYFLHVISTLSRTRGMFVGLFSGHRQKIPEASFSLLSIILLNTANALESLELYRLLGNQNKILEAKNHQLRQEIEERMTTEKALKNSEERLRLSLEASNDGIFDWFIPERKISYATRLKELSGYEDANELLYSVDNWVSYIHPDHRDRVMQRLREHLKENKPFNVEYLFLHGSGEYRWLNTRGIALFDDKRKVYRMVGATRDINDQKRSEGLIRNLTHQLINSQESERHKISLELHDSVAQDLSTARISCEMLLKYKSLTPGGRKKISEISDSLHKTLMTVRDLSYDLRPPGLEEIGLIQTLKQYCRDFSKNNGLRIDFSSAGMENLTLNFDLKINLYRMVQESLNNIKKHAEARNATIKLIASFPYIILRIADDGKGFSVKERLAAGPKEKRMGLMSMEERVSLLQGTIQIESIPNKGTKIFIRIPFPSKEARF